MLVGADEFIQNLPMKYDTLVGEGGFTLSGGQRQRVSFARAALRNSPVMIFDEPASGLDIHSEKGAKKALQNLKKARTLIIITHRLNFLELADWAVYVRNGRLIQQGVPAELINLRGSFYDFVADEINRTGYEGWPQRILKSSP
jgi:ABC-type bacteriocin/lantibiotic exporter with double-glycine peptidase domain